MAYGYILDEQGEPVPCDDLEQWDLSLQALQQRRVAFDELPGDICVSTVFLALDHSFGGGGPILWETMVFGGNLDQECERCGGMREDAVAMHQRVLARVKEAEGA